MLLILAHAHDVAARALANRWGSSAVLLTGLDLRRARWSLDMDRDGRVRAELASADGTPLPVTGVVSRLGVISEADLSGVHPRDRPYAAAELTAFLTAWLDTCPVPVLNPPPTAGALNGPAWSPEQWADAATAVGLRVTVVRRFGLVGQPPTADPEWAGAVQAHVVGDTCVGDVHPEVAGKLFALARLAGTPLLTAVVSGPAPDAAVRDISVWPDLADPEVADALAVAVAG